MEDYQATKVISLAWAGLVRSLGFAALAGGLLFFVFAVIVKGSTITFALALAFLLSLVLFLILLVSKLPSYFHCQKWIKKGFGSLIAEKINDEGLNQLVSSRWLHEKDNFAP